MRPDPFFSGAGLDRADRLRSRPDEIESLSKRADARELVWGEGFPLILADGHLSWSEVQAPDLFLGFAGESPRFSAVPERVHSARPLFTAMGILEATDAPVFAAALSLAGWHARHRFCANCSALTQIVRGGWSRSCPNCGMEHHPRVEPVVIMLVEHDGELLLGRQPQFAEGRYSALAGFVETGETIEAAVAREIREEAGIDVTEVTYVASQPWPFPSSLMIGCHARARSKDLTIDRDELEDARWFTRAQVAAALDGSDGAEFDPPFPQAIARTLLEHWLAA